MNMILLSPWDLAAAATLILLLAGLSIRMQLGVARSLTVSALRMAGQLLLVGLVLEWVFEHASFIWIGLIAIFMLSAAAAEVMRRQHRQFAGWWRFGIGATAMMISSFVLTALALQFLIQADPWYRAQYAIPLLGMMLGNTMNGIALGLNHLTESTWHRRAEVEARLCEGEPWNIAISGVRRDSIRQAVTPIINTMSVAGIVSLPGMMTGQILAGQSPYEAVKYQILIILLIAGGIGLGSMAAVWLGTRRLFDQRHRLRLDRLMNTH